MSSDQDMFTDPVQQVNSKVTSDSGVNENRDQLLSFG